MVSRICVPGNPAYLIMGERSLARLAEIAGDKAMAARRTLRVEKGVKGMRDHLWDEAAGTFLSVKRDTLMKIPGATIGSWIPLAVGVPTKTMAKRMAEELASPAWMTPLPVPTVDRTDKRWKSNAFWRGDVWPPTNYQIASGLAAYGHKDLAADICDKTIANGIKNGISEHYDSISGKPLGVAPTCLGCKIGCSAILGAVWYGISRRGSIGRAGCGWTDCWASTPRTQQVAKLAQHDQSRTRPIASSKASKSSVLRKTLALTNRRLSTARI